jgi:hypothetical protein
LATLIALCLSSHASTCPSSHPSICLEQLYSLLLDFHSIFYWGSFLYDELNEIYEGGRKSFSSSQIKDEESYLS